MCITEYNEAETMEQFKEEGREEGRQEGREEGLKEGLKEGIIVHLINVVYKKMLKGKTSAEIAGEIEEDVAIIDGIKRAIITYKKECTNEEFNAYKVLGFYKRQMEEDK